MKIDHQCIKPGAIRVILHNASSHFELRASSWFMAWITLGVGITMAINPTMLTGSINAAIYFRHMTDLASQDVWRALFLLVGTSRAIALTINGSFPSFKWTPHIRFSMSALSVLLWSEVAYSVMGGMPTIGTVVYPFICLLEAHNAVQAFKDMLGKGLTNGQ